MCHIVFLLPLLAVAAFLFLPPAPAAFVSIPLCLVFFWLGACPSNRKIGKFRSRETLAELPIVDPGASCEVDFFQATSYLDRLLGVSETENAFYQQSFWLYGSKTEIPHLFLKTNADLGDLERLREVQVFLSFASFPWNREVYDQGLRLVEYRELAFADHPLGILGGPLSLRIWMDELGSVREMKFGHRF